MAAEGIGAVARERYTAAFAEDTSRAIDAADPEQVREAAREFESLLVHQLLKSMRATIPQGGMMDGGYGEQVFGDMLDMEYARLGQGQGGFGLADLVAEQLGASNEMPAARPAAARAAARSYQGQAPGGFMMPVAGRVSSTFGPRQLEHEHATRNHPGMDIAAPEGTPIRAAAGGRVVFSGERGGYGNAVIVDHGNGVQTLYAHASELLVREGDAVTAGTPIARVGSTGYSTGPHLHFEVRRDGRPVDPAPALGLK